MKNWKGSFAGAVIKGREAARKGEARSSCPYPERVGINKSGVTFSRAFRKAWLQGYDDEVRLLATSP